MATGRFRSDPGLTTRMVSVMFLLGLLYVVAIAVVIAFTTVSPVLVLVVAGGFLAVQYWYSDKIALYSMGGRLVTPQEAPELHGVIDRLCAMSDLPKPAVAIADSDLPNAFATGRTPKRAVVCATTGILRRLTPEELEGVLAHELSHVAHRDVAVMTIASFLGVLAGIITRLFLYSGMYGGFGDRRGSRDDNNNGAVAALIVLAVSVVVYALSFVLIRTLSRYRELAADRAGAMLTGRPSALASALTKVTGDMGRIPTRDLRAAEAFNAFFFAPAIAGGFSLSSLFSTHPTLEVRLAGLDRVAAELGRTL